MKSDTDDDGVVSVNQKRLISALLEMERQYSLEYDILSRYLKHIEQACLGIHQLLESCRFSAAKEDVIHLLFPHGGFAVSEEMLKAWRKAADSET